MDKSNKQPSQSAYQEDLKRNSEISAEQITNQYVIENGNKVRIPYKMVREVVFSNISKSDMLDSEHAARLQYRLMLNDSIIKARVHYIRGTIRVIYNPVGADNLREKISLEDIIAFLSKEGVSVDRAAIDDHSYDYYANYYSKTFNPASIREHPPYGYTKKEWIKMKPEWEKRKIKYAEKSEQKQKNFQMQYLIDHPELADAMGVPIPEIKKKKVGIL
ncbi:MAG: hypothetical protein M1128_00915 [Candidatus Marsarchaeota archaeon]|nr:hypothetical protein [Candidatus Marsarchaeota archaeon]